MFTCGQGLTMGSALHDLPALRGGTGFVIVEARVMGARNVAWGTR